HTGKVILFGDFNEVRNDSERFGSIFSSGDAAIFNYFIQESGLIDLPMGGRSFTWMNKVGSKYSHTKEVKTSRMNLLLADMRNLDQKIDEGLASDEDKSSHISKFQELDYFEKMNSLDLMQKARVKWEVEGDENSKFFHGLINSRRKSQSIQGIMHEGVWLSDPKDIKEAFLNFYKKKFSCHDSQVSFPSFMFAHRLNTSDQDLLEAVVSMEEIKTTEFVVSFFSSGKFPQGVNSAFITLIPKVSNPLFIKDYRHISLIGLHHKIVAKILCNRLSKVIDSIISPEQSAFISGRQILDGPLILSEIIDWYKKRKKKLMLFKVDFEKAFDSLGLLFSSMGVLLWNSLSSENQNDMENITRILNIFYIAFDLKINFHKSNVFGVGVSNSEVVFMAACTGCEACFFPFHILAYPLALQIGRFSLIVSRPDCRVEKLTFSSLAVVLLLSNPCLEV
nr:RNA-directed DNA polymerase, eukaryota, reverse transcriptase zinc-binding domain protein [Tanacetum cinerariifolium]